MAAKDKDGGDWQNGERWDIADSALIAHCCCWALRGEYPLWHRGPAAPWADLPPELWTAILKHLWQPLRLRERRRLSLVCRLFWRALQPLWALEVAALQASPLLTTALSEAGLDQGMTWLCLKRLKDKRFVNETDEPMIIRRNAWRGRDSRTVLTFDVQQARFTISSRSSFTDDYGGTNSSFSTYTGAFNLEVRPQTAEQQGFSYICAPGSVVVLHAPEITRASHEDEGYDEPFNIQPPTIVPGQVFTFVLASATMIYSSCTVGTVLPAIFATSNLRLFD